MIKILIKYVQISVNMNLGILCINLTPKELPNDSVIFKFFALALIN